MLFPKRRLLGSLLFAGALATGAAPAEAKDKLSKSEKQWLEEEVAAIITDTEAELFQEISKKDRKLFQEIFWARRDFNPLTPENEFQQEFEARRAAADRNFKVRGRKGSATDMGKIFVLLGPPSRVEQGGRSTETGGGAEGAGPIGGGGSPVTDDPGGGGPAPAGIDFGDTGSTQTMTWVYDPNPSLGLPEGLTVQFRAQTGFGYRLVRTDELEETLERVKQRYITNPAIGYARDDKGRLQKPKSPADPNSPAKQILRALAETGVGPTDVALEAETAFFRAAEGQIYIPMLLKIDGSTIAWDGDKASVVVFGQARNAEGNVVYQFEEPVELRRGADGRAVFEIPIQLFPGDYQLAVGILEDGTEKAGTFVTDLHVPDYYTDELQLSSIILFSGNERTGEQLGEPGLAFLLGGYHWIPKLDRRYKTTDELQGVYNAYGYGLGEDGQPKLTVQYVFHKDGRPRGQTKDEPFALASPQMAISYFQIPLASFEPGEYRLEIKVTDHVKNQVVTENIDFVLEGEGASE